MGDKVNGTKSDSATNVGRIEDILLKYKIHPTSNADRLTNLHANPNQKKLAANKRTSMAKLRFVVCGWFISGSTDLLVHFTASRRSCPEEHVL